MTAATTAAAALTAEAHTSAVHRADPGAFTAGMAGLRAQFPARPAQSSWPQTRETAGAVLQRLGQPPFHRDKAGTREQRLRGVRNVLGWLDGFDGITWQQRWLASGAEALPGRQWQRNPTAWLQQRGEGSRADADDLSCGLLMLVCADVIRPSLAWMLTRSHAHLTAAMTQLRDPEGFALLAKIVTADPAITTRLGRTSIMRIALIAACKGGGVRDITVGDCVELVDTIEAVHADGGRAKALFYRLLHTAGILGADAPATIRAFTKIPGQLTAEELVDRYQLTCKPVRDLFVGYLQELQPRMDYNTLRQVAGILCGLFWADLERHQPGIESLHLSPQVAAGWKGRIQTRARTVADDTGKRVQVRIARRNAKDVMYQVRAFYLDLAQWAADDPGRWAAWVAPCPVSEAELSRKKDSQHRKARMDARTRDLLAALPMLVHAVGQHRKTAAARLEAARQTKPGEKVTAGAQTLVRVATRHAGSGKVWCADPETGARRDLTFEETDAFWAWAAVEVLRHTGIRIEELCELSHHSITEYRLPSTGELVPLLQIAPSKMDAERLVLVSPELADVLSAIVCRIRILSGAIPAVASYDPHEKVWNAPMPLLFQRPAHGQNRPYTAEAIRDVLRRALSTIGLTGRDGQRLHVTPHDFRRIFVTDAVMNGLPPHIAQVICGHRDINTTMGYKAIYPAEAIEAHRAFIARRRKLRPGEEYRTPSDEEWDAFLAHFEKRKMSAGTCARAFGTPCIHEHACIRCSLLRPDPVQRDRLIEIRDNLHARIAEAEREGWLGEIEGLQVSLAGANEKIAQLDRFLTRRATATHLGMPTFSHIAARTTSAEADHNVPEGTR